MYIKKIVKMKDNKYKIYIDEDYIITYDNVILENDLLYKKTIDTNLYNEILLSTNFYDIYNKTIKYILKRRRSEKEITEYLNKYNITNEEKNNLINKLKDIKLINDKEYCKAYINDKLYLSKEGINKIKEDLLIQNIPIELIEEELNNVDMKLFNNRLEKIIIKKINSNKKYSNNFLKSKIINEMINLGYDKEKILNIINNNLNSDLYIIEKEFNKIYDKLKSKYDSYELKNKIKTKLVQKGFNLDDINKLLKEKTEE